MLTNRKPDLVNTENDLPLESNNPFSKSTQRIRQVKTQFLKQLNSMNSSALIIGKLHKYNVPRVVEAVISTESIQGLLDHDQRIKGLPRFIEDFLDIKPSQHRETLALKPELIAWTADKNYLLMPNPSYSNHELLIDDPRKAKSVQGGFGLIAWFIHPALLAKSNYSERGNIIKDAQERGDSLRYGEYGNRENLHNSLRRINSFSELDMRKDENLTVGEIVNNSGVPYLSGPFDYKAGHLPSLKALRDLVLKHLADIYGVTENDKVDLYFHTHYSIEHTTMHLHVRVNQLRHGFELNKSIFLDDIIDSLEKGVEIKGYFAQRGVMQTELSALSFLNKIGYQVREIDNPYFVDVKKESEQSVTYHFK